LWRVRVRAPPLAGIFVALRMVNATYTGTEPLAAFFAVLAVPFLRG
jgi:hypothetical protein